MASSFQRRRIRITFQLATGSFAREGNPDSVVLEDFRTKVEIHAPGGAEFAVCKVRILGLKKDVMDRLTVINYLNLDLMRNVLRVEATDENGLFVNIFVGELYQSHPEYMGAPDVPFVAEARSGMIGSLTPAPAVSYPGARKVSEMMAIQAAELGMTLENNGVDGTLTDQYLVGSPVYKIQRIAADARIQFWFLQEQGVLAIAPMGKPRTAIPAVTYNIDNGLVGWPTRLHNGVAFTALFKPQMSHGCKIVMESSVPACNGEWYVISMSHRLDAMTPGGAWFTDFVAAPENVVIVTR